ncbi:MAG: N-acetyltransferase [Anaerolineales bacterium]|uniref:N-acetyltransferase n=1 Tax=Candidatus Desulfolinea nitratireducens TaxID=2841698 RepID=A0A8J6NM92_9CHLR|nr:N-acetyltransferase [Candidatus Desulfolinea nitratireducens]MBL6960319.1 N-acetyltransferase [Anaerolineales bacterium]
MEVVHNQAAQRFELQIGEFTPVLDYRLQDKTIAFTHTGVPTALEGNGIGSFIVRAGLDYAREQGYQVIPLCSFVAAYIRRHPEYEDLLNKPLAKVSF